MGGWLSFGPSAFPTLFVYGVSILSMIAMLVWILAGGRSVFVDVPVAGVLFVGAVTAALVGLVLLPLTFIGLFVLVGVLGLVPFGTAAVCWSAAKRALASEGWNFVAFSAMTVVLVGWYALAGDAAIARATRAFQAGYDRDGQTRVIEELVRWRGLVPDKVIARRGAAQLGPGMFGPFADRYQEVTGVDLQAVDPRGTD